MTVAQLSRVVEYLGNGSTTAFAVPFQFLGGATLAVVLRDPAGAEQQQTLTTDYSVSGGEGATGVVVFVAAPANGLRVVISGNTPIAQERSYVDGDTFPAKSHEGALDQLTMIAQEQRDDIDEQDRRALKVGPDETAPPVDLAGADGKALALIGGTIVGVDNDPASAADSAAAALVSKVAAVEAAAQTANDRAAVHVDRVDTEIFAQQAQLGAVTQRFYPGTLGGDPPTPGARSFVPQGATIGVVDSFSAGTGGTDGTFQLAFTGGNFAVNPSGSFTVAAGAVTMIAIDGPGIYFGDAISPPTPDFSASAGLTDAAAALATRYIVPAGEFYVTDHATDNLRTSLFQNQSSAAIEVQADFGPGDTALAREWAISDDEPDPVNNPGEQSAKTYSLQAQARLDAAGQAVTLEAAPGTASGWLSLTADDSDRIVAGDDIFGDVLEDASGFNAAKAATLEAAPGTASGWFSLTADETDQIIAGSDLFGNALGEVSDPAPSPSLLPDRFDRPLFNGWALRETRRKLNQIRRAVAGVQLSVVVIGDSYTDALTWLPDLARETFAAWGSASPGYTSFATTKHFYEAGNPDLANVTRTGSWTETCYTPEPSLPAVTIPSPDLSQVESATAGDTISISIPNGADAITLFHRGGSGTAQYRYNGGSWTPLALDGDDDLELKALAAPPDGALTLDIEVVSGACCLYGLDIGVSDTGIVWHKAALSGTRVAQHIAPGAADWEAGLAQLAPDLAIILLGTNDAFSYTAATYSANLATLADRIKAARPTCDLLFVTAPQALFTTNAADTMANIDTAARALADDRDAAQLSLQPAFGRTTADYAPGTGTGYFDNIDDNTALHPNLLGVAAMEEELRRTIFGELT